jgi:trimethylamine--corrinoid protein Co-methyltransferase
MKGYKKLNRRPLTRVKVVTDAVLTRIHDATVKILEETGIKCFHEGALEIFKKHGVKVDENIVFIPRKIVEKAIESAPSTFKWSGRNEEHSIMVGEEYPLFKTACSRGMTTVYDLNNGARKGTLQDHINMTQLFHSSDVCDIAGGYAIDPAELSSHEKHLHILMQVLKNTDKPFHVFTGDKTNHIRQIIEMIEIAIGKNQLEKNHYACATGSPLSPLCLSPVMTEAIIEFSKQKQIVNVASCVIGGVSGPIRLLGQVLLENTEIISGLVLSQLVRPGTPVIMEPTGSTANMKTAAYIGGTPECMLRTIPSIQMALDLYHLPVRTISGMSDSKLVDGQAAFESMQNTLLASLSGCSILDCAFGNIESLISTAYEKIIIDEEIINRCKCICEGIDVSEEALSLDVIQECAHDGGKYIAHQSTFEHFRNRWLPLISDRETRDDWERAGSEDIVIKANKEFKKRLTKAPDSLMDKEGEKELKEYIKLAIKANKQSN